MAYCEKVDEHVVAYSPLGKPGYKARDDPELLADPVLATIADEVGKGKTLVHVALRWAVRRGASVTPSRATSPRPHHSSCFFKGCI